MTTEIQQQELITQQRELIDTYRDVVESYKKREVSLAEYLNAILKILENGDESQQKEGLDHLARLVDKYKAN